jgi:hypothetical protein
LLYNNTLSFPALIQDVAKDRLQEERLWIAEDSGMETVERLRILRWYYAVLYVQAA